MIQSIGSDLDVYVFVSACPPGRQFESLCLSVAVWIRNFKKN